MTLVSVIICTYNRAAFLQDNLDTLIRAVVAYHRPVEILVVNNASTDETDAVVNAAIRENPSLTITLIHEPRQGLSQARNTGISRAQGDVICFLDDDVFVPEGWLDGLLSAFALGDNVVCVAGKIKLHWPDVPRPSWVDERCCRFYGAFSHGDESFILPYGADFFGGNVALTRRAVETIGLFSADLGRKRGSLLSGEDTEYSKRLWEAGFAIAYSANGYILHRVQPDRMRFVWMVRRNFWAGLTNYFRRQNIFYPLRGIPKIMASCLMLLWGGVTLDKQRIIKACFRLSNAFGPFCGWFWQCSD